MYKQIVAPKKSGWVITVAVTVIVILSFCVWVAFEMLLPDLNAYGAQIAAALIMFLIFYFAFGSRLGTYEYSVSDERVEVGTVQRSAIRASKTVLSIKKDEIKEIKRGKGGKCFCPLGVTPVTLTLNNGKRYTLGLNSDGINYINAKCFTDAYIDNNFNGMKSLLSELIKIPSVQGEKTDGSPFGNACSEALNKALEKCASFGMRTKNVDNYCGWAEAGEGDRLIGILCHLDVVPAGEGWVTEPFSPEEKDNRIYGRGASDDKGPAVAAIYALKAVMEECSALPCRVRLIFGLNEETGWGCMERYRASEEEPTMAFTPDAAFPVTNVEKGIVHFALNSSLNEGEYQLYMRGGLCANMVPCNAEATVIGSMAGLFIKLNEYDVHSHGLSFEVKGDILTVEAEGKSAHGSCPDCGVNAFFELFKFLDYLDLGGSQGEFVKNMLKLFADKTDGSGINLKIKDDISGRLTVNVGMCYVGKNSIYSDMNDDSCRVIIDIRYPVSYTEQDVSALLQSAIPHSWDYEIIHSQAPHYVDASSPLVKALSEVYNEYTGLDATPHSMGGGTYARAFPGKAVAFGMLMPGSVSTAHEANEYIELSDLETGAKIFASCIKRLCEI